MRTVHPPRRSSSLPLAGRVAHRKRSERCDGWGLVPQARYFAHYCAAPHPALRATLPTKVGGIRKRGRHCEERTRRSNPAFLCVGSMDCFASARNDRTKLILRTPSCVQYLRLDGLHPSHLRGGWHIVSGANDVTGGGWCRRRGILRIICAAPHSALRATLPTKWEEKKERASLQQQVNSQLAAISERISARIVSISLRP